MDHPELSLRNKIEIQSIEITHFKKIDSSLLLIDKPVNYLVGANRSGKSSYLQAVMMTIAAAQEFKGKDKGAEILCLENQLRYCPTHDFAYLGHKKSLENKRTGFSASTFFNLKIEDNTFRYGVTYRLARGEANISLTRAHTTESNVTRLIQDHNTPFAVYVPGISGITKKEKQIHKSDVYRAMFSGDAGSVFRNLLLLINDGNSTKSKSQNLIKLEEHLSNLIGEVQFQINYEGQSSPDIEVVIVKDDHTFPLELCSLGELQLIQIVAYWILLKPKILLLDEPDSHLHANTQTRLVNYLHKNAIEEHTKVIVATHSPQIINAANNDESNIFLVEDGNITSLNPEKIQCLMHLGALDAHDKQIFIFPEDKDEKYLKAILGQWSDLKNQYKIMDSYKGRKTIWKAAEQAKLLKDNIPNCSVIIHTDRDFLTDEEIAYLVEDKGINISELFVTEGSNLEWYFCDQNYLKHKGITPDDTLLKKIDFSSFEVTRNGALSFLSTKAGRGFISNNEHWDSLDDRQKYDGKAFLSNKKNKSIAMKLLAPDAGFEIASDLKIFIDKARIVAKTPEDNTNTHLAA